MNKAARLKSLMIEAKTHQFKDGEKHLVDPKAPGQPMDKRMDLFFDGRDMFSAAVSKLRKALKDGQKVEVITKNPKASRAEYWVSIDGGEPIQVSKKGILFKIIPILLPLKGFREVEPSVWAG